MRSCSTLVAAFWIAVIAIGAAEASFGALNNYLVDHVQNRDVAANLKAAADYLKELESTKSSIFQVKNPINDVRLFVSLQQVFDETQCDRKAIETMVDNQARAGQNRRVDFVMQDVFRQHSKRCMQLYPAKFQEMRNQFGDAAYNKVATIGKQVMEREDDPSMQMNDWYDEGYIVALHALGGCSITERELGNYLRFAIKENAKDSDKVIYTNKVLDERTGKSVVHKDKIKELVKEYLVQPCQSYLAKFGYDLFALVKVDAQWRADEAYDLELYSGWAYINICRALVDNESTVTSNIIEAVSKAY